MAEAKARIRYLDIAKGIAILAVIIGHVAIRFVGVSHFAFRVVALCFTFHMPLFFILSGYFMKIGAPFALGKEARRLVVPYVVTAIAVVVGIGVTTFVLRDWDAGIGVKRLCMGWANAALFGGADMVPNPLWPQTTRIGAIWFLLALFWAHLVTKAAGLLKKDWVVTVVTLVCFCAGQVSVRYVFLPWSIQAGLCASPFVWSGHYLRKARVFEPGRLSRPAWAGIVAVWIVAILQFQGFGMGICSYGNTWPMFVLNILGAYAGTLTVVKGSQLVEAHAAGLARLLEVLGQISLPILCVHLFEDDVVRWDATNAILLQHMIAPVAVVLQSAFRATCDCVIAWLLIKTQAGRAVFAPK